VFESTNVNEPHSNSVSPPSLESEILDVDVQQPFEEQFPNTSSSENIPRLVNAKDGSLVVLAIPNVAELKSTATTEEANKKNITNFHLTPNSVPRFHVFRSSDEKNPNSQQATVMKHEVGNEVMQLSAPNIEEIVLSSDDEFVNKTKSRGSAEDEHLQKIEIETTVYWPEEIVQSPPLTDMDNVFMNQNGIDEPDGGTDAYSENGIMDISFNHGSYSPTIETTGATVFSENENVLVFDSGTSSVPPNLKRFVVRLFLISLEEALFFVAHIAFNFLY
jgi:hypothetical protein